MAPLTRKCAPPRGIVYGPGRGTPDGESVRHARYEPPQPLRPWVEHLWTVEWRLPEGQVFEASTLPHPVAHRTVEAGRSEVRGVTRGRFVQRLVGAGRVVAVKFRPAGLCAFWPGSLHTLTDRSVPASRLLGVTLARRVGPVDALDAEQAAARLAAALEAAEPRSDAAADEARAIAEHIAHDRELTRVEAVARRSGLSVLALQRLFRAKVGVSPKWVLQRYRLHEALEQVAATPPAASLAPLAHALGFTDQAHFCRAFKQLIGESPTAYAARLGRERERT